jgi:hypothetical protein
MLLAARKKTEREKEEELGMKNKISLLLLLVCLFSCGCSSYNSKFKKVVAKIKKDQLFQSLDGKLRYEMEGGTSEAKPFVALLYLDYVDSKTSEARSYRCRYYYQLTWLEGQDRDWNWALSLVEEADPAGAWVVSDAIQNRPDFIKMLRP